MLTACLYNRVLPAVLISKKTETCIRYVLFLRMMRTKDRHFVWFCSSCNGKAETTFYGHRIWGISELDLGV